MLYYYFESKERLFHAVIERCYADLVQAEEALVLDLTKPFDALAALIAFNWQYYWTTRNFSASCIREPVRRAACPRCDPGDFSRAQFRFPRKVIRSGVDAGVFTADTDIFLVFMTILSLTYFYRSNIHTLSNYWPSISRNRRDARNGWLMCSRSSPRSLAAAGKTARPKNFSLSCAMSDGGPVRSAMKRCLWSLDTRFSCRAWSWRRWRRRRSRLKASCLPTRNRRAKTPGEKDAKPSSVRDGSATLTTGR